MLSKPGPSRSSGALGEPSDVDEFPRVKNRTCDWCTQRGPCTWVLPGTWLLCDLCLVFARKRTGGTR